MILIANDINDKKRKYEDKIRIQTFQNNCLHFKGPDILQNRYVQFLSNWIEIDPYSRISDKKSNFWELS